MTEFSKVISQLSDEELAKLTKSVENERKNRTNLHRKEAITNAIMAIRKVYEFTAYLEIETEYGIQEVYLTDIETALEELR